jgi:hypothetical protein
MKVLALASYPVQAAATRYRLYQFVETLAKRGITLTIRPFLNSTLFDSLYRATRCHVRLRGYCAPGRYALRMY